MKLMDIAEIREAIEKLRKYGTETSLIEAKSAKGGFPSCLDTLSSFSNKSGGLIIFGLKEGNGFEAEGVYNVNELQTKLTESARGLMEPPVHMDIMPFEFEGKMLVAAKIHELPQNEKPCYIIRKGIDRGSFTRIGERDQRMTGYELYALQSYRNGVHEDLRQVKRAELDDLNYKELSRYVTKIKVEKPNFAKNSDEKILKLSAIVDEDTPTLAGMLVFGKYPQAYFPQLFVACVAIPGTQIGDIGEKEQRFNDNQRVEGTIEEMLAGTLAFLRRNMKTMVIVNEDGERIDRPEYPMRALREAVANALVHRDYSEYTENAYVQVYMYSDRIEIINPGALYGQNKVEQLGTATIMEARNPNIIKILEEKDPLINEENIKTLENRHTGIPTMRREMDKYGLPEPEFYDIQGSFKVVFRNSSGDSEKSDIDKGKSDIDKTNNKVGTTGVTKIGDKQKSDIDKGKSDIDDEGNDIDGAIDSKGKHDKRTWNTGKVDEATIKILRFCEIPRSSDEIATEIKIRSKSYVLRKYIRPLVENNKLEMIIPEKPTSKYQKYITKSF